MPPSADITVVLGDDLLGEVFVRLPTPEDFIRATATCKPFLRAARSRRLLRRFRRLHPYTCPRVLGCLTLCPDRSGTTPSLLTSSHSSSSAAAAHDSDFDLSFLPGGGWLGGAGWKILDSRNGLLLLKNLGSQELALADPMARRYIALPAPPAERAVGYGLVTDDGDSSAFRVFCVSRDGASRELRALVLTSGELSWTEVAGLACQPDLASTRSMQANQSLYWRLEGGERMVAFNTATMEFSLLELPPSWQEVSFDVIEKGGEDGNVLHLVTMSGFCMEVWAGVADGEGGMTWRRVDKSVKFHKAMTHMFQPSADWYQSELNVIGVATGVVFMRQGDILFSIDLETMKLRLLSKKNHSSTLIYPYTIAWPPSFLDPAGQSRLLSWIQLDKKCDPKLRRRRTAMSRIWR